jgi:hypothetical protein
MYPKPQSRSWPPAEEIWARLTHRDQFPWRDKSHRSLLAPAIPVGGIADLHHTAGAGPWFWNEAGSIITTTPLYNGVTFAQYNPSATLAVALSDIFSAPTVPLDPFNVDLYRVTIGAQMRVISPDMPFVLRLSAGAPIVGPAPVGSAVLFPYEVSGLMTRQTAVLYLMAVHHTGQGRILTPMTLQDNPTVTMKQPYTTTQGGIGDPTYVQVNVQLASWMDPLTKRELSHIRGLSNILG